MTSRPPDMQKVWLIEGAIHVLSLPDTSDRKNEMIDNRCHPLS